MTEKPLFSIIIPTYKRPELLALAVQSVLAQGEEGFEILVIDDDSAACSPSFLAPVRYYKASDMHKKGANACRNLGLARAQGEYLIFLDDDDLLAPGALHGLKPHLFAIRPDVLLGKAERFGDASGTLMPVKPSLKALLNGGVKWFLSASCWRREFLMEYQLRFDEDLQNSQEWLFHVRTLLCRPRMELVNVLLTSIRVHGANRSWQVNALYLHHQAKARRKAAWALCMNGRPFLAILSLVRSLPYRLAWLKHVLRTIPLSTFL